MKRAREFFTPEQLDELESLIEEAETNTSGELRVHLENRCKGDVLDRATVVFDELKMQFTKERNAVLIYLAVIDRKFAIIGDAGINEKVGAGFWEDLKNKMQSYFQEDEFMKGLTDGITGVGQKLKHSFPYQADDLNELHDDITDEISISEN